MKGSHPATREKKPRNTKPKKVSTDTIPIRAAEAEQSDAVPGLDYAFGNQSTTTCSPSTPKRGLGRTRQTQDACLTSTPVHSSSIVTSNILECPPGAKHVQASDEDLSCCRTKSQERPPRKGVAFQPKQVKETLTKKQSQTSSEDCGPVAKRRRGRPPKTLNIRSDAKTQSSERTRPRFELEKADSSEQESLLSSDLSIELSHHEDLLPSLSFQEEEESEEEEEEDLPSFLMQVDKKPSSITEGAFVWHKLRNFPFWPALVKSVNRKQKKASIMFIDVQMFHKKKGCAVALRNLKHFDCEEYNELLCKAKEKYNAAIEWSLELITDYRIRIACGSFSGSFIEYFAHDMSYPVRRKYPQAASDRLTITDDSMAEALCEDHMENSLTEQQEELCRSSKRLLPDRSHAAHNRANEKLVYFIVKQRMVEERLLAVIRGQQKSRWLRSFLGAKRRRVVNVYLEDDQQLDQVYRYLSEIYATSVTTAPCLAELKSMESVPFILDVLMPEAIIYAIAGVDKIPVKKAEEKYLKGRCISQRERQEFDSMIERQMRKKSQSYSNAQSLFKPF